jgi:hypothetical protein
MILFLDIRCRRLYSKYLPIPTFSLSTYREHIILLKLFQNLWHYLIPSTSTFPELVDLPFIIQFLTHMSGFNNGSDQLGDSNKANENIYSTHSSWVHPSLAQERPNNCRSGKWSEEEETYAKKLLVVFNGGYIKVSRSITCRNYLAEKLCW